MAVLKNRVGVVTTTTGTGLVTLGAPLTNAQQPHAASWQTFAQAGTADGSVVRYLILDSNGSWEYGQGLYNSGTGTLTRPATMDGSVAGQKSSTGSLLVLSGNAQVFITATAEDIISPSGTITANDVAQWSSPTTIKGVSLQTWRTGSLFFGQTFFSNAPGSDGVTLAGAANQGQILATGVSADVGLVFTSKGNAGVTFYNGSFARFCVSFGSSTNSNTFPAFTAFQGYSQISNNPGANPLYIVSPLNVLGRVDNSAMIPGYIGEYVETISGPTSGLTTGLWLNVGSASLTPGDWDVWAQMNYGPGDASSQVYGGLSTTGALDATWITNGYADGGGSAWIPMAARRVSSASPITVTAWALRQGAVAFTSTVYIRARRRT